MAEYRKGRVSRFLSLTGLSTKVGASYLGQKIKRAFVSEETGRASLSRANVRNANRITRTLGRLKGTAMKVGQMLSLQSDVLPREMTEILAGLQKSAPPVSFETIQKQIESSLELPLANAFLELDEEPYASASIGQVHRGLLHDGREVVVKVQYPGVDEIVESDLKNLRMLLKVAGHLRTVNLETVLEEVRARMLEEVDYEKELENLSLFRRALAGDPRVVIPRAVPERSTRRVLTMELCRGLDAEAICAPSVPQRLRDRIGATLVDLLLRQIFELKMLHADPNPANYAFTAEGRVILYDFGCVRRFRDELIDAFRALIPDALEGRFERLSEDLVRLGFADPSGKPVETEILREHAQALVEPWTGGVYRYGTSKLPEKVVALEVKHWGRFEGFSVPPQIVFINRVLGGSYGNLRRLDASADWGAMLQARIAPAPAPIALAG